MVLPLGDLDKTRIVPIATYLLITLNVVVYALQLDRGEWFTASYAATPYELVHRVDILEPVPVPVPAGGWVRGLPGGNEGNARLVGHAPGPFPIWLTLISAMFLHGSPLHLAGNMLYLWIFGDNVEEVLGRVRYVVVYLGCGVMGTLAQVAGNPDSMIPTLGASGAIAGVMGMYIIWFPHNRVRVLVLQFITEMPALVVIGIWIALQIWDGVGSFGRLGQSGGVAYLAHVGGALTGIFAAFLFGDRGEAVRREQERREGWFYGP